MKKFFLSLIMCLMLNTGFSQDKQIGFDSMWFFAYPDDIDFRTALESHNLIISDYRDRKELVYVFNKDSAVIKTYVCDTLYATSHVCEVIKGKTETMYKTHVMVDGIICSGWFTIYYKNRWKRKMIMMIGGYSEPYITNGWIVMNPYYVKRKLPKTN